MYFRMRTYMYTSLFVCVPCHSGGTSLLLVSNQLFSRIESVCFPWVGGTNTAQGQRRVAQWQHLAAAFYKRLQSPNSCYVKLQKLRRGENALWREVMNERLYFKIMSRELSIVCENVCVLTAAKWQRPGQGTIIQKLVVCAWLYTSLASFDGLVDRNKRKKLLLEC